MDQETTHQEKNRIYDLEKTSNDASNQILTLTEESQTNRRNTDECFESATSMLENVRSVEGINSISYSV